MWCTHLRAEVDLKTRITIAEHSAQTLPRSRRRICIPLALVGTIFPITQDSSLDIRGPDLNCLRLDQGFGQLTIFEFPLEKVKSARILNEDLSAISNIMAASRLDAAVAPSRHLIPLLQDDLQHSFNQNHTGRTIIPKSLLSLLPVDAGTTLILAFTLSFYLATFTGVQVMRSRKGFDLRETLKAHYLIGFVTNVVTLGLFITELVPRISGAGFFDTMCTREVGWAPEMTRLYHVSSSNS